MSTDDSHAMPRLGERLLYSVIFVSTLFALEEGDTRFVFHCLSIWMCNIIIRFFQWLLELLCGSDPEEETTPINSDKASTVSDANDKQKNQDGNQYGSIEHISPTPVANQKSECPSSGQLPSPTIISNEINAKTCEQRKGKKKANGRSKNRKKFQKPSTKSDNTEGEGSIPNNGSTKPLSKLPHKPTAPQPKLNDPQPKLNDPQPKHTPPQPKPTHPQPKPTPPQPKPPVKKPPSLQNIGATCYLNSAFQGLTSGQKFIDDIESLKWNKSELPKLSMFENLVKILNGGHGSRLEISRNPIFRYWNKPGQQDSFELLSYALNQVYNEIRKYLEKTKEIPERSMDDWLAVSLPMRILIMYQINCSCKCDINAPLQSDLALHVAFPSGRLGDTHDLQELVDKFFDEDKIEEYECDNKDCKYTTANRIARLQNPLPNTLCIHLQRTYWNGYRMIKINDNVVFGQTLTIKSEFIYDKDRASENIARDKELYSMDGQVIDSTNDERKQVVGDVQSTEDGLKDKVETSASDIEKGKNLANKSEISTTQGNTEVEKETKPVLEKLDNIDSPNDERKQNALICSDFQMAGDDMNDKFDPHSQTISEVSSICSVLSGAPKKTIANLSTKPTNPAPTIPIKDVIYKLTSVIVHSGNAYGGHYICYKKTGDQWYLTNDSWVSPTKFSDVERCQAYILFYEK